MKVLASGGEGEGVITCSLVPRGADALEVCVTRVTGARGSAIVGCSNIPGSVAPRSARTVEPRITRVIWIDASCPLTIFPRRAELAGSFRRLRGLVVKGAWLTWEFGGESGAIWTVMSLWTIKRRDCGAIAKFTWN